MQEICRSCHSCLLPGKVFRISPVTFYTVAHLTITMSTYSLRKYNLNLLVPIKFLNLFLYSSLKKKPENYTGSNKVLLVLRWKTVLIIMTAFYLYIPVLLTEYTCTRNTALLTWHNN